MTLTTTTQHICFSRLKITFKSSVSRNGFTVHVHRNARAQGDSRTTSRMNQKKQTYILHFSLLSEMYK